MILNISTLLFAGGEEIQITRRDAGDRAPRE